jgi:hypothetical protein
MNTDFCELSAEELSVAPGSGIVDSVVSDAEMTTAAFLKRFGEASASFSTFINSPRKTHPRQTWSDN